jgi:hypothetical protein
MRLTATGLATGERDGVAVVAIIVERSPDLRQLIERVSAALTSFAVERPSSGRAVTNAVAQLEEPYVTAGMAQSAFVKTLQAEPFDKFRFIGVSVYFVFSHTDTDTTLPDSSFVRRVNVLPFTSQ